MANKQKFIIAIAYENNLASFLYEITFFFFRYKSGVVCICHIDLEKNYLNLLHKILPDSANTICCSIQFAHQGATIDRSTLFYISYAHGCIKVCDYTNGKILGQLMLVKPTKNTNINDPRSKTYYPLIWLDANTLLTGNLE